MTLQEVQRTGRRRRAMNLEHERAWMKLSATPTGLIPEGSLAFPGFGNPGPAYAIPLGLTSTSGRWKQTTQSHGFNTAYRHAWRTLTLTFTTPSHGHRSVNSDSLIVSSPIEFQVRVSKPWVRGGQNLKGLRKNNLAFWHLRFTLSAAAPQSRNPQRRPGYACGFAQSVAAKSGANLSANSTKLFLHRP